MLKQYYCRGINSCPAEPDYALPANSVDPDQLASEQDLHYMSLKTPYSSKIDILVSKKGLINWYITITKCGTWQPVKFQLVSHFLNQMIFYQISELMLQY